MSTRIDPVATSMTDGQRRYALGVLAVVYMFNFIDRQILAILLPSIKVEFTVSDTVLGLLTGTAFALFYVGLGVPIARYADRANRRNLIALAVAIWSGMTAISGAVVSFWQLVLARVGVGIGEAGCSPPAHSMIADMYPPEKRSAAMGVYTLGISAGIMLAYLAGGWIAENVGWRQAFFAVGLPGILLALIVRFTVQEPARGASEQRSDSGAQPSLAEVATFLLRRKSFIYMAVGSGLSSWVGYSIIFNMPSFLVRSFDASQSEIGVWLGLIYGIAGGFGFFMGGYIADRIGQRSHRKALGFLASSTLLATIFNAAVFLSSSMLWCLVLLIIPSVISNFYLAPVLGQTQSLVSLRMRAVASSLILLILNFILVMGQPITGFISDLLAVTQGIESMRYSLLIVSAVALPIAAWCYWRAGSTIERDLERASEKD
jgi:MFS family permease